MKEKVKIQKFRTSPATYQWFDPKGELHPPPSDARPYYTKEDMFARGVWPEYKSDWMNKVALIPEAENVLDESDTMDTEQTEPVDD